MTLRRLSLSTEILRPFQRILDLLLILLAHSLALVFSSYPRAAVGLDSALLFVLLIFTAVTSVFPVYRPHYRDGLFAEIAPVLVSWTVAACALEGLLWAHPEPLSALAAMAVTWPLLAAGLLCGWRVLERPVLRTVWSRADARRRVAIVGATASANRLCRQLAQRPWLKLAVVGVYDDRGPERREAMTSPCCIGTIDALVRACQAGTVEAVYVALPLSAEKRIEQIRRRLADTPAPVFAVADILPSYEMLAARWTAIGSSPLVSVHDTPIQGLAAVSKRLEDLLAGVVALLLLALPMTAIAILVKATSPGPVFFRQRRYGLNGQEIRVLKFRTMTVCEDGAQIKQAERNDTRVTPVGRFLRRSSLDELPQFLQLLTGEMSLVGPRPHAVAHNEQYRALIPQYMLRHKVKPGITGWAQVNGWRGETPTISFMQKRIEHDLQYINNWSIFLDLKIVILTIFGRATRHNAY